MVAESRLRGVQVSNLSYLAIIWFLKTLLAQKFIIDNCKTTHIREKDSFLFPIRSAVANDVRQLQFFKQYAKVQDYILRVHGPPYGPGIR
jgi:hypothetical protein